MKVQELFESAERAAVKLAKQAGKDRKPGLSKAAVLKSFGDVWDAYKKAYDEARKEADAREEGEAWREKRAASRQGRQYHEGLN